MSYLLKGGVQPGTRHSVFPLFPRRSLLFFLGLLALVGVLWGLRSGCRKPDKEPEKAVEFVEVDVVDPGLAFDFPTDQTQLAATNDPAVYMPTASGRMISALYGSTRTSGAGGNFRPRFHEGIDIAPMERDRRGLPLDAIRAVADGRVGYVQSSAGGSSYGRYVVLLHEDSLGTVYSLYAHLARVEPGLTTGGLVDRGAVIGRMGHSSSTPIPVRRAHLHLEIGVILNQRFDAWLRANGFPPAHGVYHGWNLFGMDPLRVLLGRDVEGRCSIREQLRSEPVAYSLALPLETVPDYYRRYPDLWEIKESPPIWVLLDVSEGAVPLRARPLRITPEDPDGAHVRMVDTAVLGRNGRAMIRSVSGEWRLTTEGKRWLDMLTFF